MTVNQGSWFENADHHAVDDRRVLQALMVQGGVGSDTDCVVSPGAGLSVSISAGHVFIPGSVAAGEGYYHGYNDGAVTKAVGAPSVTARTDLIIAETTDSFVVGGGVDKWDFRVVQGTTGAYPNPPATPNNAIVLAQLDVQPGDASFVGGDITKKSTLYSPRRGVVPCLSTARPGTPNLGTTIYETNTKNLMQYQGATLGWTAPWNLPWGEVAADAITNNTTGVGTTVTEIAGLDLTATLVTGRKYIAWWDLHFNASVASESCRVYFREGGVNLQTWEVTVLPAAGVYRQHSGFYRLNSPSSGSHTYKMHIKRSSASGTVGAGAGSEPEGIGRMWLMDVGV